LEGIGLKDRSSRLFKPSDNDMDVVADMKLLGKGEGGEA